MKLKNVKKEIEEPLSKLKDLYQKRKSLLENIKKAIDKRTDYVKKLEIAIQVNNNLPRVETKTMEDIFNRLKLLESANISIDKYIKITEELFEDPQLTLF
jgi:predicted transcriptional regulator